MVVALDPRPSGCARRIPPGNRQGMEDFSGAVNMNDDFSVLLSAMAERAETRRQNNLRLFLAGLIDIEESELPENIMSEEFARWFNERSTEVFIEFSCGRLFIDGVIR